jgi:hypothetical protein
MKSFTIDSGVLGGQGSIGCTKTDAYHVFHRDPPRVSALERPVHQTLSEVTR